MVSLPSSTNRTAFQGQFRRHSSSFSVLAVVHRLLIELFPKLKLDVWGLCTVSLPSHTDRKRFKDTLNDVHGRRAAKCLVCMKYA